jgi:hypothetical protein
MAGTHTDITERAKVEERLEKLVAERTAELRAARDRAELDASPRTSPSCRTWCGKIE